MERIGMQDRVCLVTGSNEGIGKVTARELARQGATVVMVCRNRAKGEEAQAEIKAATNNDRVDLIVADLASLAEVRRVAEEFQQRYPHLHVLIHNAGGIHSTRKVTPDGLETTFTVNYLAPFLLTELLLERLKASTPARIINVSSMAHAFGTIDFGDLQGAKKYSGWKAYNQSKLALVLSTYELASRLEGSGVTVNALHPGGIASQFGQGLKGFARLGWKLLTPFLSSVEQGAQTTLYLATSPRVETMNGLYFENCQAVRSSKLSYNEIVRHRLWQISESLVH